MPWCPKCKNEYVAGIIKCSDCNIILVDVLDEAKPDTAQPPEPDHHSVKSSSSLENSFFQQSESPIFTKASERKEEYSSSFSAFVFVFLLTTMLVVISQLKMIPFFKNHTLPLQYTIILSLVAIVSLILAYYARRKTKRLIQEVQEEELILSKLISEFKSKTDIPQTDNSLSEEEQFFIKNEWILSNLRIAHPDYTESYCDYVAEQLFSEIFEKNNEI